MGVAEGAALYPLLAEVRIRFFHKLSVSELSAPHPVRGSKRVDLSSIFQQPEPESGYKLHHRLDHYSVLQIIQLGEKTFGQAGRHFFPSLRFVEDDVHRIFL